MSPVLHLPEYSVPSRERHHGEQSRIFWGHSLILGLASRTTGLVLTGNMLVAYLTADLQRSGSILSDPGKFYDADPYTFLFASLMVLVFGAGLFSVDAVIARFTSERHTKVRTPADRRPPTRDSSSSARSRTHTIMWSVPSPGKRIDWHVFQAVFSIGVRMVRLVRSASLFAFRILNSAVAQTPAE